MAQQPVRGAMCSFDPLTHSLLQRTVSSIPSKFETTLHKGRREQNAFGGRTFRFRNNEVGGYISFFSLSRSCAAETHTWASFRPLLLQNDIPGPGSYYKKPTLVRSANTCGSVSHLGFGSGFVSKSKRFTGAHGVNVPGPGSYESPL